MGHPGVDPGLSPWQTFWTFWTVAGPLAGPGRRVWMRLAVSGKTVAATWRAWRLARKAGSAPAWGRRDCRSPRRCKSGGVTLSTLVCSLFTTRSARGQSVSFQHAYKSRAKSDTVKSTPHPSSELAKRLGRSLVLCHPEHVETHGFGQWSTLTCPSSANAVSLPISLTNSDRITNLHTECRRHVCSQVLMSLLVTVCGPYVRSQDQLKMYSTHCTWGYSAGNPGG